MSFTHKFTLPQNNTMNAYEKKVNNHFNSLLPPQSRNEFRLSRDEKPIKRKRIKIFDGISQKKKVLSLQQKGGDDLWLRSGPSGPIDYHSHE